MTNSVLSEFGNASLFFHQARPFVGRWVAEWPQAASVTFRVVDQLLGIRQG